MVSNPYKKLGGQALIYGMGNIVPRILNYAVLTVYFTRRFPPEKYGIITELYAYVAIFLVILTYGMETGLFKFSTSVEKKEIAYSSVLSSLISTSLLFAAVIVIFRHTFSSWIGYPDHPEYIVFLGFTLSIDAISAVIFAKLRIESKVRRFALIKILNVVTTVIFVFLFLEFLPRLNFITSSYWYHQYFSGIDVGYVFIANLISSLIVLIVLLFDLRNIKIITDWKLLKRILTYSIPLLISGLAGIFNETIDRILLRQLSAAGTNALYELGIYGANYRIAVLMTIFVQMFRYAAEPFFFNEARKDNSADLYGNVLKYFTIFLMIIFLGVGLGIDFFKLFIDKDYHEGLSIVPVVLMANVLVGLLFNVNMWYKLSGDTLYGVYITGIGALITVGFNILFIPEFGYIACAWTHLLSNGIMLALTYFIGQKKFKIYYDVRAVGLYIGLALLLYGIGRLLRSNFVWLNLVLAIVFVVLYFFYCNKRENLIGIFLKKHES